MKRSFAILVVFLCLVSAVRADLIVDAGNWNLSPNTPDQSISVSISGVGSVTDATVMLQILGGSPLPSFTGGDMTTGTIFASNNTGAPTYIFSSQLAYMDLATNSGTVDGNGILATLKVSTVGVTSGSFTLETNATVDGMPIATNVGTFPPVNVTYQNGSLNIVPEPSSLALLLVALGSVAWFALKCR